jgi:ankyrin repeat protein
MIRKKNYLVCIAVSFSFYSSGMMPSQAPLSLPEIEAKIWKICDRGDRVSDPVEKIKALLEQNQVKKIEGNYTGDMLKTTALHAAVIHNHKATVKLLLTYGANPNIQAKNGLTALHYAAFYNRIESINDLLEHGANTTIKDNEGDIAHDIAIQNNHSAAGKALLLPTNLFTATTNAKNTNHQKTLMEICANEQLSEQLICAAIKPFLTHGQSVNNKDNSGDTALHCAILREHTSVMKILIDNHANVNVMNSNGHTPLYYATMRQNDEAIKLLVNQGADINTKLPDATESTVLHYPLERDTLLFLIEKGADVNAQNNEGWTPLHIAASHDNLDRTLLFLNRQANTDLKTNAGQTARDLASSGSKVLAMIENFIENAMTTKQDRVPDVEENNSAPTTASSQTPASSHHNNPKPVAPNNIRKVWKNIGGITLTAVVLYLTYYWYSNLRANHDTIFSQEAITTLINALVNKNYQHAHRLIENNPSLLYQLSDEERDCLEQLITSKENTLLSSQANLD